MTLTMQLSEQQIRDCLPIPPFSHKYDIIQQSPQVWRVDLIHPMVYTYTTEQVHTVWGFIKPRKGVPTVYPPYNSTKPRRTPLCDLSDISEDLSYTTIIPKVRSLLHL